MADTQQLELNIIANEHTLRTWLPNHQQQTIPRTMKRNRWIRISIYAFLLLVGQLVAVYLGRLYFTKGGKSNWLETLVQLIGFPILIPLYYILPIQNNTCNHQTSPNHSLKIASIYAALGLLMAVDTMCYSVGLQYLPISTYSLICASQLGFNALFSFFLNGQNFTPCIINSLVLLTISSTLLVFQENDVSSTPVSKDKYTLGFILTVVASFGYGLMLSLTEFVFRRVLRGGNVKVMLDMIVYESLVATFVVAIGLFACGEWRTLKEEMRRYESGKVSYVMTLVWTALLWQVSTIGVMGLVFEASALFSNVVSALLLPLSPMLAVIFFHDQMNGIKGVATALAVWGFVSYAYQQYLDEYKSKSINEDITVV